MRLHYRLPFLALGLLLASCETLAGSGGSAAEFTKLKEGLAGARGRLDRAVAEGATDQIAEPLAAVGAQLDEIQSKSSAMNLLDRENLAIQAASGRGLITTTQQWVANGDIETVRSEVRNLNGVLDEVNSLLDRAIRSAAVPSQSSQ